MTSETQRLNELLERITKTSSAYATVSDAAYVCMRELDGFGAAAVGPLMELIDKNQDIWFDAIPPLFWLVERAASEARGLFLRHLRRGDRRSLCIRGLIRAGAASDVRPLLGDPSASVRLGAAFTLACAPEVDATDALRGALRDEQVGETALAMRLALLRRGVRAPMSEGAFALQGADTPAASAWTRVSWLRDSAIQEVAAAFDADDDARLDRTLAARAEDGGSSSDTDGGWAWRSGAPLSSLAARGLDALLRVNIPYGGDVASPRLLLTCARYRLDAPTIEALEGRLPSVGRAIWASEAWIDSEGARLEKGDSKKVYARLTALEETDRPEATQWLAHGLCSLRFAGYRHSLWRHAGPLVQVTRAAERLSAIPDRGLSSSGERTLMRGALSTTVRLGKDGSLLFVDAAGKLRKSPPKPKGAAAEDVAAVTAAHKELRKLVENTWKLAGEALESAMIAGRRFTPEEWRARFVDHPISAAIGASLIFLLDGPEGGSGSGGRSFWTGEGAPRGLDSGAIEVNAPVRIAHPVDLSPEEIQGWRARIANTKPAFAQLERAVHSPTMPVIAPGPYDLGPLRRQLAERGYVCGRDAPRTYHCRYVGPYFMLVLEHAAMPWSQTWGTLEMIGARVRRDELDVPAEAVPRSIWSELREDLERLGIEAT